MSLTRSASFFSSRACLFHLFMAFRFSENLNIDAVEFITVSFTFQLNILNIFSPNEMVMFFHVNVMDCICQFPNQKPTWPSGDKRTPTRRTVFSVIITERAALMFVKHLASLITSGVNSKRLSRAPCADCPGFCKPIQ